MARAQGHSSHSGGVCLAGKGPLQKVQLSLASEWRRCPGVSVKSPPVRKAPELSLLGKQISQIQSLAPLFWAWCQFPGIGAKSKLHGPTPHDGSARLGAEGDRGLGLPLPSSFHVTQQQSQTERVGSWCHYQSSGLGYS